MEREELVTESPKYRVWRQHLETNGLTVHGVEEQFIQHNHSGDVLYALVKLDAETPEKIKMPPVCLIKGDAVSVLVVLIDKDTNEKHVLLVKQRRICNGAENYEHPAGMIDEADSSPLEVAVRELKEETGLDVKPDEVKPLFNKPLYSASSTSDEALHFFYLERRMKRSDIQAMHGRVTGEKTENEHTTLHIAPLPEAHQLVSNMHGVLGHLLYLKQVGDLETLQLL